MASNMTQPLLVVCIIYVCGFVIELLIRLSQGIPHPLPSIFNENIFLILAQPFIFILGPALFWPIASLYRIIKPIARMCLERRSRHQQPKTIDSDGSDTDSDNGSDSITDLEKGYLRSEKSRESLHDSFHNQSSSGSEEKSSQTNSEDNSTPDCREA